MPPTSLLDIAPELRLFIYREAFRRLTISFSDQAFFDSPLAHVQSDDPKEDYHLSILLICRKLYEEARPLLLANAVFDLSCPRTVNTILPLEFARMTRIIISTKSISDYLRARNFFFQDMAALLENKAEIHIEITSSSPFRNNVSFTTLKSDLQRRINSASYPSSKYSNRDLVRDCSAAVCSADRIEDDVLADPGKTAIRREQPGK